MPCIFHVSGERFQPEVALKNATFKPYKIYQSGEKMNFGRPGAMYTDSGFSVYIGAQDNWNLAEQIEATQKFVQDHFSALKLLADAEELRFDYGYKPRRGDDNLTMLCQCDSFDPAFLKTCGELNIAIELSLYGIETDVDS
jgi:hypothetical protein